MKRKNPNTGKPFVRGESRDDGFLFLSYNKSRIKKDGTFGENWVAPHSFQNQCVKQKQWSDCNLFKRNETQKKWRKINLDKVNAQSAKRRAARLQCTPKWLSREQLSEIADMYTIAKLFQLYSGEIYHVDHIIPLRGKNVSGLHVPWNLQIITQTENQNKSNKLL